LAQKEAEARALKNFLDGIREIKSENEALRRELRKYRRKPSGAIGYLLLLLGAAALISSIIVTSSILAFIGLGLTLWGALLLFIRPVKFIRSELLDSTVISSLSAVNKVVSELKYKGRGIYLPPRRLKGLSDVMVYIPSKNNVKIPSVEKAAEKVFLKNPNGLCLPSAGAGLMSLYEKELGVNFSKVELDYLQNNLPKLFIEDLEMFEDFEMNPEKDTIHVKITGSIYKDLCNKVNNLTKVCESYGCPVCASIACAITKATGRPLRIENILHSQDYSIIEIWYRFADLDLPVSNLKGFLTKLRKNRKS